LKYPERDKKKKKKKKEKDSMALTTENRQKVATGLMRYWSTYWEAIPCSSDDVLSVVVATDNFQEGIQGDYNSILPEPFRASATVAQKTFVFCAVALARVSLAFARRILGEVD